MIEPVYIDAEITIYCGDCAEILAAMPAGTVDAIVTDPPYELGFMGKSWDASGIAYDAAMWAECLRVLKPGGHLLAFGGTRTYHRMACAIEDAGFEVRDSIHWIYGSGFPKSLDVSKAIDKAVVPATPEAREWQGWGTALKPAHEPIVVARKPLAGTVAANVLARGTGALNIDGCRVGDGSGVVTFDRAPRDRGGDTYDLGTVTSVRPSEKGRWPANIVLTHAPACADACADRCPVKEMDAQSGKLTSGSRKPGTYAGLGYMGSESAEFPAVKGDVGGAARFFPVFRYQAKAPTFERPVGTDGTKHATVKPLELMRWLVRLVTPPGGVVLDPFAGSGTTIEAAILEGFEAVGIERDPAHVPLIIERLNKPLQRSMFNDLAFDFGEGA